MTALHPLPTEVGAQVHSPQGIASQVLGSPVLESQEFDSPGVRIVGRALGVAKQYHKFSAAHFLIFADGNAERLHGHNYRVAAELATDVGDGLVLDFKVFKALIDAAIADLDERLLLPGLHPELRLLQLGDSLEVRYRKRRYVVPADEVLVLPIGNTSVEELAAWIGERVAEALVRTGTPLRGHLTMSVEETDGQRGSVTLQFGAPPQLLASRPTMATKWPA